MVLHLSTFHLEGGAGVAATRLHRALLKSGADSQMLVAFPTAGEPLVNASVPGKWGNRKAWANFTGERLAFLPQERDKSVRFAFSPAAVGFDIARHPLVQQADILHLHWVNFGFLSIKSLKKLFSLGKPIVWTMHDMWTLTGGCHYSRGCEQFLSHCQYCPYLAKPDRYDIAFQQFEQKAAFYQLAKSALVSPSTWLNALTRKAALTSQMQALCIPNCIDTHLFQPLDKQNARLAMNLPAGKKLVLFAGANVQDPRKGFLYFQEAVTLLKDRYPGLEVLIFGKAGNEILKSFPVPVHYLGKISDPAGMVNAYNAADLIAVPSLEDNLPNTIMEAMSCGTPAVGFETGGIPDMIGHLENGYIAAQGSAVSLAEGISWILDQNKDSSVSVHARNKVLESYAEEVVSAQYLQLYKSLLNE